MLWFALISIPYAIIILLAWINLCKVKKELPYRQVKHNNLPAVSVIVAARNEENNLPELISDLQNQDYPPQKLEIIIADDNSSDRTSQIIKEADKVIYLLSKAVGKKMAIASALEVASGELILTTDADCRLSSGWVQAFAESFLNDKADLIIGQVDAKGEKGLLAAFIQLEFLSIQAITAGLALAGRPIMCNGASLGFRKSYIQHYPEDVRADLSSGDDIFLLHSVKKKGGSIIWPGTKSSNVVSSLPENLRELFSQRGRWTSKSVHYNDADTIVVGLSTLLLNLSLLAGVVLSVFNPDFLTVTLLLFMGKLIPDILILTRYLKIKRKMPLILYLLPLSIIYPFYVLISVLSGLFPGRRW